MNLSKHSVRYLCLTLLTLTACGDGDAADDHGHEDGGSHEAGAGGAGGSGGASGSGGTSEPDAAVPSDIEVAGAWVSMFGTETYEETIDDTMWNGASIIRFDNADNEAITQDPPSEDDAGVAIDGSFNKLVWTEIDGDAFYYCWVSFGQASAAGADANAMPSDDSDPDNGGCGDSDFPWTKLVRR